MCRKSATVCLTKTPSRQHRAIPAPAERLCHLADPRDRRGRRHTLLTAASAVLAGARSYLAVGQ